MDCPGLIILQRVPWWLVVCCFTSQAASYRINNEGWKYANNQMEIPPEYHQKIWEKVLWSERVRGALAWLLDWKHRCVCVNGNLSECQGSNVSHTTKISVIHGEQHPQSSRHVPKPRHTNDDSIVPEYNNTWTFSLSDSPLIDSNTNSPPSICLNLTASCSHLCLFFIYLLVYLLLFCLRTPTLKINFHSKLLCWHHSSYCWKKKKKCFLTDVNMNKFHSVSLTTCRLKSERMR